MGRNKKLRLNIEKEMAAKIKEKRELEKEIKSLQEQIEDQAAAEIRVRSLQNLKIHLMKKKRNQKYKRRKMGSRIQSP